MKTTMNNSMRKTAVRVIGEMAVDALLGAVCGGLYGVAFGGLGALVQSESHRLISVAGYFALCGAAAAGMVGACGALWEARDNAPDPAHSEFDDTEEKKLPVESVPVEAVQPFVIPGQRQLQNSLVAPSSSDQRRTLTIVSKHPLSC